MQSPRIRKDYRSLSPAQRQRFFTCLRMLDVLPPTEPGNIRAFHVAWKIENGQRVYKTVSPLNIHDEFISSHQTTCQHGMPYFVYYHRHLLICVQLALNYAQQVLLGGASKLPVQLYSAHSKAFDAVFRRYQQTISRFRKEQNISGQLPALAMHYWDPSDYTQSIEIPVELREHKPDEVDELLFSIHKHYSWNFNFASRWFKEQGYVPRGFETNGFFQIDPAYYSETQIRILKGDLNPHTGDPNQFFRSAVNQAWGDLDISAAAAEINAYKNYRSLVATSSTINLCTLDQDEIDTLFGSKRKKLHWITQGERTNMKEAVNRTRAYTYNKALPHFQYAYSLFKGSNDFIRNYVSTYNQHYENSLENCHNTIHNNLQRFMSDAQLSITHPLFFLYHSWIDLALETKARLIRNSRDSRSQFNSARSFMGNIKFYSILNQVAGEGMITFGQYPIFEWCVPVNRLQRSGIVLGKQDYQAAFPGYGMVLNDQVSGIRLSDELTPFYRQNYVPSQAHRYKHLPKFASYNFNYTYLIRDYDSQGKVRQRIMGRQEVPIPSFIEDIFRDYDSEWNQNKVRSIAKTQGVIRESEPSLQASNPPAQEETEPLQLKSGAPPPEESPESTSHKGRALVLRALVNRVTKASEQDYFNQKDLLKAVRQAFAGYAEYSSTIRSVVAAIELRMTEAGFKAIPLSQEHRQIMKEGLVISFVPILSRGAGSVVCPNCKPEKTLLIECTENLAEMNEDLFCALARGLSREVIYQIEQDKEVELKRVRLSEMFELRTARSIFNRLQMLEGAIEITCRVKFHGNEDFKSSSVKINGFSYIVQTGQLANVVSKSNYKLDCIAQLSRLVGVTTDEPNDRHYLYRRVAVHIRNGDQFREFSFNITTFHELVRYQIDIYERQGPGGSYLDVKVSDEDFAFKQIHYHNSQYVL